MCIHLFWLPRYEMLSAGYHTVSEKRNSFHLIQLEGWFTATASRMHCSGNTWSGAWRAGTLIGRPEVSGCCCASRAGHWPRTTWKLRSACSCTRGPVFARSDGQDCPSWALSGFSRPIFWFSWIPLDFTVSNKRLIFPGQLRCEGKFWLSHCWERCKGVYASVNL